MAASLDALAKADLAAHSVQEQLADPANAALSQQLAPYAASIKRVVSGKEAESKEGAPGIDEVTAESGQIYGQLQQADAAPTQALMAAAAETQEEGREALRAWKEFEAKQLPALNELLRREHHAAIDLRRSPDNMPESGDED